MLLKVIQFSIIYLVLFLNETPGIQAALLDEIPIQEAAYQLKEIPKSLENGTILEIKGLSEFGGQKFAIDFMDEADGNIGFHMKFRLGEGPKSRRIAFNSYENGRWSNEEVYTYPDVPSWPKLIRITAKTVYFQIDINDYSYPFKYRMPIERIKFFGYGGHFRFDSVIWK